MHLFQIRTRILMDFASASGQNVLLVGPPGSGKTTLINDFMDFQSSKYSKTCLKRPLSKKKKMGFQDVLSLNAGQKYCRMLQGEHSAILSTCIELPHGFKTFVLSIF